MSVIYSDTPHQVVPPTAYDLSTRPLLKLALENARPVANSRIEWMVDRIENGNLAYGYLSNYTQILRRPFTRRCREDGTWETFDEAAKSAVDRILDDAENVLWYGKPSRSVASGLPLTTCGGVLYYLRRRPRENDTVVLRELQALVLLKSRGEGDEFNDERVRTHEWLWEFSLQVNPGHYERGMKPVVLPPAKPSTLSAFPQGSELKDEVEVAV